MSNTSNSVSVLWTLPCKIGPPPEFISNTSDGWKFWALIKNYETYKERREYIATHFAEHYKQVLVSQKMLILEHNSCIALYSLKMSSVAVGSVLSIKRPILHWIVHVR